MPATREELTVGDYVTCDPQPEPRAVYQVHQIGEDTDYIRIINDDRPEAIDSIVILLGQVTKVADGELPPGEVE